MAPEKRSGSKKSKKRHRSPTPTSSSPSGSQYSPSEASEASTSDSDEPINMSDYMKNAQMSKNQQRRLKNLLKIGAQQEAKIKKKQRKDKKQRLGKKKKKHPVDPESSDLSDLRESDDGNSADNLPKVATKKRHHLPPKKKTKRDDEDVDVDVETLDEPKKPKGKSASKRKPVVSSPAKKKSGVSGTPAATPKGGKRRGRQSQTNTPTLLGTPRSTVGTPRGTPRGRTTRSGRPLRHWLSSDDEPDEIDLSQYTPKERERIEKLGRNPNWTEEEQIIMYTDGKPFHDHLCYANCNNTEASTSTSSSILTHEHKGLLKQKRNEEEALVLTYLKHNVNSACGNNRTRHQLHYKFQDQKSKVKGRYRDMMKQRNTPGGDGRKLITLTRAHEACLWFHGDESYKFIPGARGRTMADEDDDPDNSGEIYEAMDKGKKQQADANTTYKTERKEERKRVAELKKELAVVAVKYDKLIAKAAQEKAEKAKRKKGGCDVVQDDASEEPVASTSAQPEKRSKPRKLYTLNVDNDDNDDENSLADDERDDKEKSAHQRAREVKVGKLRRHSDTDQTKKRNKGVTDVEETDASDDDNHTPKTRQLRPLPHRTPTPKKTASSKTASGRTDSDRSASRSSERLHAQKRQDSPDPDASISQLLSGLSSKWSQADTQNSPKAKKVTTSKDASTNDVSTGKSTPKRDNINTARASSKKAADDSTMSKPRKDKPEAVPEQDNLSEEDGDGAIDFDVSGLQSSTPLTSRTGNDGISTRPLQGSAGKLGERTNTDLQGVAATANNIRMGVDNIQKTLDVAVNTNLRTVELVTADLNVETKGISTQCNYMIAKMREIKEQHQKTDNKLSEELDKVIYEVKTSMDGVSEANMKSKQKTDKTLSEALDKVIHEVKTSMDGVSEANMKSNLDIHATASISKDVKAEIEKMMSRASNLEKHVSELAEITSNLSTDIHALKRTVASGMTKLQATLDKIQCAISNSGNTGDQPKVVGINTREDVIIKITSSGEVQNKDSVVVEDASGRSFDLRPHIASNKQMQSPTASEPNKERAPAKKPVFPEYVEMSQVETTLAERGNGSSDEAKAVEASAQVEKGVLVPETLEMPEFTSAGENIDGDRNAKKGEHPSTVDEMESVIPETQQEGTESTHVRNEMDNDNPNSKVIDEQQRPSGEDVKPIIFNFRPERGGSQSARLSEDSQDLRTDFQPAMETSRSEGVEQESNPVPLPEDLVGPNDEGNNSSCDGLQWPTDTGVVKFNFSRFRPLTGGRDTPSPVCSEASTIDPNIYREDPDSMNEVFPSQLTVRRSRRQRKVNSVYDPGN